MSERHVFVTGGSGYIGRALVHALLARGHTVRALVRQGSQGKLPNGVIPVFGDALEAGSYSHQVASADTIVQLVGTPHPGPSKAAEFQRVDLPSGLAAVRAAIENKVGHLVYVSVAQPAPVMRAYIDARAAVETEIRRAHAEAGLRATVLRPWYVLGPSHRWPYILLPVYAIARLLPSTRTGAERLGLVTHAEMVAALVEAVEQPPDSLGDGIRIWDVPRIRRAEAWK